MPASIIDALVVTLGLDNHDFRAGQKQTDEDLKRTREAGSKTASQLEADGKRAAEFFRSLRNEVVGLFFAFAGASTLKDFAAGIIAGDAATGRLATNLGMATEKLSAWEGAVGTVGGKAEDADVALRAMVTSFQNWHLAGNSGHDEDLKGLHVSLKDLSDPTQALLKMAEAGERLSKPEFVNRLQRIGIPESVITMLERGRKGTADLLAEQERLGVTTDKDAKSAEAFQAALATLKRAIQGAARPEIEKLTADFVELAKHGDDIKGAFDVVDGALHRIAIGFNIVRASVHDFVRIWQDLKSGNYADALQTFMHGSAEDVQNGSAGNAAGGFDASAFPGYASQKHGGFGGGDGGGAVKSGNMGAISSYLSSHGFSGGQASGIAAWVMAESGGNPEAANNAGGGQGAHGIGQWRGPRLRRLREKYGDHPTMGQQLEFLVWELMGGDPGGKAVRASSGGLDTLRATVTNFGRADAAGNASDIRRGAKFLGIPQTVAAVRSANAGGGGGSGGGGTTNVGPITIHTQAADAHGIARDLSGALRARGLVVQAQSGMTS